MRATTGAYALVCAGRRAPSRRQSARGRSRAVVDRLAGAAPNPIFSFLATGDIVYSMPCSETYAEATRWPH